MSISIFYGRLPGNGSKDWKIVAVLVEETVAQAVVRLHTSHTN